MSYLLTQLFLYLLVAFLLGLILGWLIWRYGKAPAGDYAALKAERDDLHANLAACRKKSAQDRATAEALHAEKVELQNRLDSAPVAAAPTFAAAPASTSSGTKPQGLTGPRGGQPDDLKRISGVGPKLEQLLFDLGFYHFDQVANWTDSEVAWVDDNLEGFKGRVSRDNWIDQAKILARE